MNWHLGFEVTGIVAAIVGAPLLLCLIATLPPGVPAPWRRLLWFYLALLVCTGALLALGLVLNATGVLR